MIVETSVTVLMRVFCAQNLAMLAVVHTCTSFHFVLIQNFLTSRCQPNESMLERKRGKWYWFKSNKLFFDWFGRNERMCHQNENHELIFFLLCLCEFFIYFLFSQSDVISLSNPLRVLWGLVIYAHKNENICISKWLSHSQCIITILSLCQCHA